MMGVPEFYLFSGEFFYIHVRIRLKIVQGFVVVPTVAVIQFWAGEEDITKSAKVSQYLCRRSKKCPFSAPNTYRKQ